jgi:uncharacterized protein
MKLILKLGICVLLFSVLNISVYAQSGLKATSFLNDFADVLTTVEESEIELILDSIHKGNGSQVAVAIVESLEGRDIESFSIDLAREWGVGSEERDDGMLMVVAPNERGVRIEVGRGLEGYVTDAQASWLIRYTLTPHFKEGDYAGGIKDAALKIKDALDGLEPLLHDRSDPLDNNFFYYGFMILWFFFPLLGAWLGRDKRIWPGGLLGLLFGVIGLLIFSFAWWWIIVAGGVGLLFDWIASNSSGGKGGRGGWWIGGGGSGGDSDSFGGFGGGSFGGGGASGSW